MHRYILVFSVIIVIGLGGWYYVRQLQRSDPSSYHPTSIVNDATTTSSVSAQESCIINVTSPVAQTVVGEQIVVRGEGNRCMNRGGVRVYDDGGHILSAVAIAIDERILETQDTAPFEEVSELRFAPQTEGGYIEVHSALEDYAQKIPIIFDEVNIPIYE